MFGGRSFDVGAQGLDSAEDLVDGWLAKVDERATRFAAFVTQLGELTASADSAAGRVSVTVGVSGAVTALQLDETIRDRPAADTAREILATLEAARAALATKMETMSTGIAGADADLGRAEIASLARRFGPDA
jgi:hypothetical protein